MTEANRNGKELTLLIRDDGPLIHCGDSPSYRSVSIKLTEEQQKAIELKDRHEQYSTCFVEKIAKEG